MIGKNLLACALLGLTVGAAAGREAAKQAPFNAGDYPAEIRKSFDTAVEACREADDGKVTFATDTVRSVDLTGDGRQDFVVSLENTRCSTFESVFCGTGGCPLEIYVALPDGTYRNVFSDQVRAYKILPGKGKGPQTIRFDMHGGYCNTYGAAECTRQRRITDKPFAFKDR
jgi:hypothetical protein